MGSGVGGRLRVRVTLRAGRRECAEGDRHGAAEEACAGVPCPYAWPDRHRRRRCGRWPRGTACAPRRTRHPPPRPRGQPLPPRRQPTPLRTLRPPPGWPCALSWPRRPHLASRRGAPPSRVRRTPPPRAPSMRAPSGSEGGGPPPWRPVAAGAAHAPRASAGSASTAFWVDAGCQQRSASVVQELRQARGRRDGGSQRGRKAA